MADKLKVDDLRAQLAQRGLSTIGTKPTLVKRLQSATREDSKQLNDTDSSKAGKKRERDSENDDSNFNGFEKIKAVEKFREMGIKELRQQASLRGISVSGSKKEILQRLCQDLEKDQDEICQDEEKPSKEEEKLVTATKKGAAVLDQWLPEHIKAQYHVLQVDDEIYDAMLNQTNVGDNNNKFYLIQALESDDGGKFMVYNRWGRVGVKGQDKTFGPYASRDNAIQEFEEKFFSKTKNHWSDRKNFISYPKSYSWLEMDYNGKDTETDVAEKSDYSLLQSQPRETKLEQRIAKFISLICNISMMKQQMMEIGYNANKLPLGKLSKSTILKGYDVLKRIADVIEQPDRKILEQLSGEFYTVIPHDFGFKKMREFVIDTPQKLKLKLEMVEALGEIEVATRLLNDGMDMQEDPLYAQYQRLHCQMEPIEVDSDEFFMVAKYMQNTHAKTHSNYTVSIVQIFRVKREGEVDHFRKFSCLNNRMLLWHGSRLTNWTGILSRGLRIAPPEAPVTGYMFGKGVYFADMFSKSANYCYASHTARDGDVISPKFTHEVSPYNTKVALGEMAELHTAKYDAGNLPEGKLSTKGVGGTAPDFSEALTLEDGVVVPLGKPKQHLGTKGALLYNEYIVYNVDQIQMRYVVHVNFDFKRR